MRTHRNLILAAVSLAGMVAVAGIVLAQARTERTDCPGKITCPRTGEIICRDQCPTVDPDRTDCPGRIVCPLTGELVCKDRCPVGDTATKSTDPKAKPACCREGK